MTIWKFIPFFMMHVGIIWAQCVPGSPFDRTEGQTIRNQFPAPVGYSLKAYKVDTFADKLRELRLQVDNTDPKKSDGSSSKLKCSAVVDWPIENQKSRQCADTVIGLWVYHLLDIGIPEEEISFTIPIGNYAKVDGILKLQNYSFEAFSLKQWKEGVRLRVAAANPEKVYTEKTPEDVSHEGYITFLYENINSAFLNKSMEVVSLENMSNIQSGYVLIRPATETYGHVQIIVNVAENDKRDLPDTHPEKIKVIIADGNMKGGCGTEMRIVKGTDGPWQTLEIKNGKIFGEYTLYRFKNFG